MELKPKNVTRFIKIYARFKSNSKKIVNKSKKLVNSIINYINQN
jgi:predicted Ser/Thr protein kinase